MSNTSGVAYIDIIPSVHDLSARIQDAFNNEVIQITPVWNDTVSAQAANAVGLITQAVYTGSSSISSCITNTLHSIQSATECTNQQVESSWNQMISNIVNKGGQMSTALPGTLQSIGSTVSSTTSTIGGIESTLESVVSRSTLFKKGLEDAASHGGTGFAQMSKGITTAFPVLGSLSSAFSGLGGILTGVALPIGLVVGALALIVSQSPALQEALGNGIGQVAAALGIAFQTLLPVIQQLWFVISTQLLPPILQIAETLGNILAPIVSALMSIISALIPIIAQIMAIIGEVFVIQLTLLGNTIQIIVAAFTALWNYLCTNIGPIFTSIGTIISSVAATISQTITNCLSFIQEMLTVAFAVIQSLFTNGWEFCKTTAINAWSFITQSISTAWNGIKCIVSSGISNIMSYISGLPSQILSSLGSVGSLLTNAGRQIIDGFLAGLQQSWEKVKGFVSSVGEWIAAHKGPKSYDLALLVPHGGWIMSGLKQGLEQNFPYVKESVSNMASELAKSVGHLDTDVSMRATGLTDFQTNRSTISKQAQQIYHFSVSGIDIAVDTPEKKRALEMLIQPILMQHRMGVA